jgi:ubiquinone/menaquinone biosynthesis C-methylase UbiE
MAWTKDTSHETAVSYRNSFNTIVGAYMDSSEQLPIVESMKLNKNSFLLDAGCGSGRFLKNMVPEQAFIGFDISIEMLKVARNELKRGMFVVGK